MIVIYRVNYESEEELQEPYVVKMPKKEYYKVELFNHEVQVPFLRKIVIDDELDSMEEDTPRMIHLKIRVLNDRIEEEQLCQTKIVNYQEDNAYKIVATFLCTVIMCLIIFIIEQYAHVTMYFDIDNVNITDLKSVGALFFFPLILILVVGIIVATGWEILLLKRIYVIEDPHDHVRRSYDAVLKRSKARIKTYEERILELRTKLINLR